MRSASERWAGAAALAIVAAVISPAVRNHDSFPLSTYPVYADVRPREMVIDTVVGETASGREAQLSIATIAATDDPLIAQQRVRTAVAAGRAGELCGRIAARAPADVAAVLVVHDVHDAVRAASGEPSLISRRVVARCGG